MKLVICEGEDDRSVIQGLCQFSKLENIQVEHCGGRTNLESYLRELPKRPEFTRNEVAGLAIVIDAETSAANSWQKIVNGVRQSFCIALDREGDFTGTPMRIGGFVVSADDGTGMIEDLCLQAVASQPGFECLEEYFRCLSEKTGSAGYPAKAKFRAWMASQSDFDLRVGRAADKGYLPWDSIAFEPLRQFLAKL